MVRIYAPIYGCALLITQDRSTLLLGSRTTPRAARQYPSRARRLAHLTFSFAAAAFFVASSSEPDAELEGLQNVVRAFHDTRTFMYGEAEATKLNLFKFRKDSDFDRWNIEREKGSPVAALNRTKVFQRTVRRNCTCEVRRPQGKMHSRPRQGFAVRVEEDCSAAHGALLTYAAIWECVGAVERASAL